MAVITPNGILQETINLLKNGAPVVTGSDVYGQNLTLHSNNSIVKGAVVLDENTPSYGPNSGALQAIGGIASQHNVAAGGMFLSMPYGYSLTNIIVPSGFGGVYNVGVGGPTTPTITISAPQLVGGVQATATATMSAGAVVGIVITNPGTGYTTPPTITFQDPSVSTATFWSSGATVAVNQFIKAYQSGSGQNFYYQVTTGGTFTTSAPTHTSGTVANGSVQLLYVGTGAQGYSAVGYGSAVVQGCIHQLGAVTNLVITTAGSAYTQAPDIILGRPDMVGGKQALAVCTVSAGAVNTITVTDPGSGYLSPPTVQFVARVGGGSGAVATAVIGSPGEKPIVSTMPQSVTNSYFLDFGLTGHNTAFLSTGASSTIFFDNLIASGSAPFVKGFPLGRKISLYVKNTGGSPITITFSNLSANNTSTNTAAPSISGTRTARFDFIVLTQTVPGGTSADVFMTTFTS